jgi:tRNA nucleotidyltransferase (CCA-adding enzyme)
MPDNPKLIDKLASRLPSQGLFLLDSVRDRAEEAGFRAFLVGGTVRDLLLDRESLDVDIAIEGDAVALAGEVAAETGARLAKTTSFGTATLRADGFSLDLARTRAETYARPGALPRVRPSSLDADLLRRDFTMNALAVQITAPAAGKLFDPVGGLADLRAGQVRVLHDKSFQDDATRIIRAVRYEARFGFRMEERTLDLLRRDLAYLGTISGTRIRQELTRTFGESDPARPLARLRDLEVLHTIHPALDPGQSARWASIPHPNRAAVCFALLAFNIREKQVPSLIARLSLTRPQAEAVRALPALRALTTHLKAELRPSEIDRLLKEFPEPALVAYAAAGDLPAAGHLRDYLSHHANVRPALRGDDLIELGVLRGPDVGDVLELLRAAKLDGEVKTREDEVLFVEEFLARERIGLA